LSEKKNPPQMRRMQAVKKVFLTAWWTGKLRSPATATLSRFHLNPSDSGREICKVVIFLPENGIFLHKNHSERDVHAAAPDFSSCPA